MSCTLGPNICTHTMCTLSTLRTPSRGMLHYVLWAVPRAAHGRVACPWGVCVGARSICVGVRGCLGRETVLRVHLRRRLPRRGGYRAQKIPECTQCPRISGGRCFLSTWDLELSCLTILCGADTGCAQDVGPRECGYVWQNFAHTSPTLHKSGGEAVTARVKHGFNAHMEGLERAG